MTTDQEMQSWVGHQAVGPDGEKIGKIADLYLDDQTGKPEWLAVSTGLLGSRRSFVPLQGATADSQVLRLAFTKEQVKDAPNAEADGHLSEEEEARLYEHYGVAYGDAPADAAVRTRGGGERRGNDDAMTRSEEELQVGTTTRETGRARLRKWVDTERVSQTVPVSHEEVRIEREPITEGNIAKAMDGPEIAEGVVEVPLMEEEAVAAKRTVPKERVRVEKDLVTEEANVGADLRKERIDTEMDPPQRS